MSPTSPTTPRRATSARRRARVTPRAGAATEPPPKKRRYIPGGPGGGGRYIEDDDDGTPTSGTCTQTRLTRIKASANNTSPSLPKRERSTRARTATNRFEPDDAHLTSTTAAAAVMHNEGYKPREERGWEEFHPNLDIDATLMIFRAEDVDGVAKSHPPTPARPSQETSASGDASPIKDPGGSATGALDAPTVLSNPQLSASLGLTPGTPPRRRGRPPRNAESLYAHSRLESAVNASPRTPKPLPIQNQNSKEKLDLKLPSYRRTDRILLFESKKFGQARYVDKSMMNVGYQESDHFIRPERKLIKATDSNFDEDTDLIAASGLAGIAGIMKHDPVGRVEYDMDEQDDMWLEDYNTQRKANNQGPISREIFEITITKIEKEWHALEKRIPKPNRKPPQTHRPRSSSAVAVNGEPQAGEEVDSKCAVCDDGDYENANAIVFCDGCDLAVHQECYGVPFIPEGQWLCRKCQLIGRGIPTCIFCPNTDGAFKQTNSSKWAHLVCAMWIPEVYLGNHTFMEPVMDVEKVPKTRWKLSCYICQQKMGACIQCGNKSCYQAFHVTCARRARLYLKMKNSQGIIAPLDGNMVLKALCDKHCPSEHAKENNTATATKQAQRFYKRSMKNRIWATNQASARELAAAHNNALTQYANDESQMMGAKLGLGDKKKGQPNKAIWKFPSGAPVIPQAVFALVDSALSRFTIQKRREFIAEACRYWTLKREARRGAALIKRLQLQMETFSSMELPRRNFAAMGTIGKTRLEQRMEFAKFLVADLQRLKEMADAVVEREAAKLEEAETLLEFVDTCYFPVYKFFAPVMEKAFLYDKNVFHEGLSKLQAKLDERFYTTVIPFAKELCDVVSVGINTELPEEPEEENKLEIMDVNKTRKNIFTDKRERKRLGKRILKTVQPQLELALKTECDINQKAPDELIKELGIMVDAALEFRDLHPEPEHEQNGQTKEPEASQDIDMPDAPALAAAPDNDPQVFGEPAESISADEPDAMDIDAEGDLDDDVLIPAEGTKVNTSSLPNGTTPQPDAETNGISKPASPIPPQLNGFTAPSISEPSQATPPTPPQSNGSLGKEPVDVLTDGGAPWYLRTRFKLAGTMAREELWTGREAVRSLSEELTDIDDDELRGLEEDTAMESPQKGFSAPSTAPALQSGDADADSEAGADGEADPAMEADITAESGAESEAGADSEVDDDLEDADAEGEIDDINGAPEASDAEDLSELTPAPPEEPVPEPIAVEPLSRKVSPRQRKTKESPVSPLVALPKKATRSVAAAEAAAAKLPKKGTRSSARLR